ncbi:MAG: hypothetical protein Q7S43_05195 [bacterium]|nr:hypothetical protein [bacterium]
MKAEFVVFHDDPPCTARLVNGSCPECKFTPDMQSLSGQYHCPNCHVELQRMICPRCLKKFEKP